MFFAIFEVIKVKINSFLRFLINFFFGEYISICPKVYI
jgi:hypothetical protein